MALFKSKKKEKEKPASAKKAELSKEERLEKGQILCSTIVEILGKPKEHLKKTFDGYLKTIREDADLHVVKMYKAPLKKKDKTDFYTTFAEIELWFRDHRKIIEFCLDYMPSSIEVIEPEHIVYRASDFSDFLTDLQGRLHQLDMAVKTLKAENGLLKKSTYDALKNLIILSTAGGPLTIEKMSKYTGVDAASLKPYLDRLVAEGKINKEGNRYSLKKK